MPDYGMEGNVFGGTTMNKATQTRPTIYLLNEHLAKYIEEVREMTETLESRANSLFGSENPDRPSEDVQSEIIETSTQELIRILSQRLIKLRIQVNRF